MRTCTPGRWRARHRLQWLSADYFKNVHGNLATRYNAEDNYVANLIGALAQIDAGVTTLVDWCHNITSLEMAERAIDGLADSGIRAVFAHGTAKPMGRNDPVPFTHQPHPRDRLEAIRKGRRSRRTTDASRWLWRSSGRTGVPGRWSSRTSSFARELGLVSSSHTRRNEDSMNANGYTRMAKAGLLGPDHNLVHGTSYDAGTLRMIADSGASLTSTVLVGSPSHR